MLRSLPTTPSFVTSTDRILADFILPALKLADGYSRGVGYFTADWLRMAASGLAGLAARGGKARIIASPKLREEDARALNRGMMARNDARIASSLRRTLAELEAGLERDTLATLAWMVADGLLDFRLAVASAALDGDFHDKFGVFSDASDAIAFRGSPNDSERAFRNYESISAYYSWTGDREAERVAAEQRRFEAIWNGEDPNLLVMEVPEAIRRDLVEFTERLERPYSPEDPTPSGRWRHQAEALEAFMPARRGVLEMATGTGKTRTAIGILGRLREEGRVGSAMVVAHGTDLLDQWHRELVLRTDMPVFREYAGHREGLRFANAPEGSLLLSSRANLAPLLRRLRPAVKERTLAIFDEVHGMGSSGVAASLGGMLDAFTYRLGLSATPERAYDPAGNAFVAQSIGPVVFRFTLEQAIERGILCEFDYVPLGYSFSDEDREEVRRAIRRHHARARSADPAPVESLYRELARVRKLSKEKLAPFREWARERRAALHRSLVFVETAGYGALVQDILMLMGIDYHTYYGDDDRANLRRFADGGLECLVTCKRISEGIDIRSVETVVLFATSRARLETIQRLGRCLRIDPGNPGKRPLVLDFVRSDDLSPDEVDPESSADAERRSWFEALSSARRGSVGSPA